MPLSTVSAPTFNWFQNHIDPQESRAKRAEKAEKIQAELKMMMVQSQSAAMSGLLGGENGGGGSDALGNMRALELQQTVNALSETLGEIKTLMGHVMAFQAFQVHGRAVAKSNVPGFLRTDAEPLAFKAPKGSAVRIDSLDAQGHVVQSRTVPIQNGVCSVPWPMVHPESTCVQKTLLNAQGQGLEAPHTVRLAPFPHLAFYGTERVQNNVSITILHNSVPVHASTVSKDEWNRGDWLFWNGRKPDGTAVKNGFYTVQAESGGVPLAPLVLSRIAAPFDPETASFGFQGQVRKQSTLRFNGLSA